MKTIEPGTSFSGGASGKSFAVGLALGDRDVARLLDEPRELAVGDLGAIHPEAGDRHLVNGLGVGHRGVVGPHPERAAGHPDHAFRSRAGRGLIRAAREPLSSARSVGRVASAGDQVCEPVEFGLEAGFADQSGRLVGRSGGVVAAGEGQEAHDRAAIRSERSRG